VRVSRERRWVRSSVFEREKDNVSGQGGGKRTFSGRKRILNCIETQHLAQDRQQDVECPQCSARLLEPHDPAIVVCASKHFRMPAASLRLLLNKRLSAFCRIWRSIRGRTHPSSHAHDTEADAASVAPRSSGSRTPPAPRSLASKTTQSMGGRTRCRGAWTSERLPTEAACGGGSSPRTAGLPHLHQVSTVGVPNLLQALLPRPPPQAAPGAGRRRAFPGRRRASPGRRRADLERPPTDPSPLLTEV
jgi:hypothetical protein